MHVDLKGKEEELVLDQIDSGHYANPSEVVSDALRLFQQHQDLREAIQEGVDCIDRGDYVDIPVGTGQAYAERIHQAWLAKSAEERDSAGQ